MRKIEYIVDKEEMIEALRENALEFELANLYSGKVDYQEAIGIITQKQIILEPVYLSHPMVALNVLEVILKDFTFKRNPITMHSDLMQAFEKYSVALAYIEKERHLNIFLPTQISNCLNSNIKNFLYAINRQSYSNSLLINIGDLENVNITDKKIQEEIQKRTITKIGQTFVENDLKSILNGKDVISKD